MENEFMGKCYSCKFRREVLGSCHSSCAKPIANVKGSSYGIRKGWFFWPFDFDPVWLEYCDSYESNSPTR